MKILLLEDNQSLGKVIKKIFEDKNHQVDWFENGETALYEIVNGYDCFILDIHVPGLSGMKLLKEVRDRDKNTPAVIISSNIELETIQKAYSHGCNDFLKKPFYMYELECKIEMLCKKEEVLDFGNGYFYNIKKELLLDKDDSPIKLSHKEHRLILFLSKHPNKIVTIEGIEEYVWEGEECSLSGLRSLVKRLRNKVSKDFIKSENYGYKLFVINDN